MPTTAGQCCERKCFLYKGTERKDEVSRSTSWLPLFSPNYYRSAQFSVSDLGQAGKHKGFLAQGLTGL